MSDYKGAALMLPALPKAKELLADKGYDADWFRAALSGGRETGHQRKWSIYHRRSTHTQSRLRTLLIRAKRRRLRRYRLPISRCGRNGCIGCGCAANL